MQNITDIIEYKGQILHRTSNGKFFTESPRGGYEYVDGPEEGLKKFAVIGTVIASNYGAEAPKILKVFNTLDEARNAKLKQPKLIDSSNWAIAPHMWEWGESRFALSSPELWIQEIY